MKPTSPFLPKGPMRPPDLKTAQPGKPALKKKDGAGGAAPAPEGSKTKKSVAFGFAEHTTQPSSGNDLRGNFSEVAYIRGTKVVLGYATGRREDGTSIPNPDLFPAPGKKAAAKKAMKLVRKRHGSIFGSACTDTTARQAERWAIQSEYNDLKGEMSALIKDEEKANSLLSMSRIKGKLLGDSSHSDTEKALAERRTDLEAKLADNRKRLTAHDNDKEVAYDRTIQSRIEAATRRKDDLEQAWLEETKETRETSCSIPRDYPEAREAKKQRTDGRFDRHTPPLAPD